MDFLRAITSGSSRGDFDLEALPARLLEDVGIEPRKQRSIVETILTSFAPSFLIERIAKALEGGRKADDR